MVELKKLKKRISNYIYIVSMKARNLNIKKKINKFYLKYYSIKAGNNNPKLNEDKDKLIKQLEKLLI